MRLDDPNANDPRAVLLNQPGSNLTPGTIALLISDIPRTYAFWFSMMGLQSILPPGLCELRAYQGNDVPALRNQACKQMAGDWIWFIDDDHGFQPDTVFRLLNRDVDIIQPLCLRRVQPFLPVATGLDEDYLDVPNLDPEGIVEVLSAGSSGMLIKRSVIEAVEEPWFELRNGISEDVTFCQKARDAGFKIHVDAAVTLGHAVPGMVWPKWDTTVDPPRWATGFTVADGAELKILPADRDKMRELREAAEAEEAGSPPE